MKIFNETTILYRLGIKMLLIKSTICEILTKLFLPFHTFKEGNNVAMYM